MARRRKINPATGGVVAAAVAGVVSAVVVTRVVLWDLDRRKQRAIGEVARAAMEACLA